MYHVNDNTLAYTHMYKSFSKAKKKPMKNKVSRLSTFHLNYNDHDRKKTNYLTFEIGFDYFRLRLYIEPPNQLIDRLPAIDCLGFIICKHHCHDIYIYIYIDNQCAFIFIYQQTTSQQANDSSEREDSRMEGGNVRTPERAIILESRDFMKRHG
jgi:ferredoxin